MQTVCHWRGGGSERLYESVARLDTRPHTPFYAACALWNAVARRSSQGTQYFPKPNFENIRNCAPLPVAPHFEQVGLFVFSILVSLREEWWYASKQPSML